jgi:biopolymer transport protein ExbD
MSARIEIIPLIDIMFFLLATFMMVSLSQTHMKGIRVNLPAAVALPPSTLKTTLRYKCGKETRFISTTSIFRQQSNVVKNAELDSETMKKTDPIGELLRSRSQPKPTPRSGAKYER